MTWGTAWRRMVSATCWTPLWILWEGSWATGLPDWWPDEDGDTYGDAIAERQEAAPAPSNHVGNNDDCDDTDSLFGFRVLL